MKKYFYLLFIVIAILVSAAIWQIFSRNDGHFIYTLDDSYIHLSIAKNVAQYGVWGVTQYEPAASSSSVLWTLILSICIKIFGYNDFIPLILNIILTILLFIASYKILTYLKIPGIAAFVSTLAALQCSFFVLIFMTGMEQLLLSLLGLLFLFHLYKTLINKEAFNIPYFLFITFFMCLVRYEGFIFVFSAGIILLFNKNYKEIFISATAAVLAFLTTALIQYFYTGSFFAGTLFTKTRLKFFKEENSFYNYFHSLHISPLAWKLIFYFTLMFITSLIVFYFYKKKRDEKLSITLNTAFILTIYSIICFAINYFFYFRYLSTVLFLWIIFLVPLVFDVLIKYNRKTIANIFLIAMLVLSAVRTYIDYDRTLISSNNIYAQQYQMSEFVHKYYNNDKILLNDVGLVGLRSEAKIFDYTGLAMNHIPAHSEIYNDKNIKLAMLYKSWIDYNKISDTLWTKTAEWTIYENFSSGDSKVTIYAIDKNNSQQLINNMKEFYTDDKKKLFKQELFEK